MIKFFKTIETVLYFFVFKTGLILNSIPALLGWDGFTRALMRSNARLVFMLKRGRRGRRSVL